MPNIIVPHFRILYENILEFLPDGKSSFVVYNKAQDGFYSDCRTIKSDFEKDCVWNYTLEVLTVDLIQLTELFNHCYITNKLDVLTLLKYTDVPEHIDFLNPLFDGEHDYKLIMDLMKDEI